jgi:F-type H+-transporting ATPase subunit alpha
MRQVAGRLRLDMAQYREVAAFAQFGSDLDKATQAQLSRGQRLQEILKQPQYQPMPLEEQVVSLFAGTNGYADPVPVNRVKAWQTAMLRSLQTSHASMLADIAERKQITAETEAAIREAIEAFNRTWQATA